jgi:hypothetical protein
LCSYACGELMWCCFPVLLSGVSSLGCG